MFEKETIMILCGKVQHPTVEAISSVYTELSWNYVPLCELFEKVNQVKKADLFMN